MELFDSFNTLHRTWVWHLYALNHPLKCRTGRLGLALSVQTGSSKHGDSKVVPSEDCLCALTIILINHYRYMIHLVLGVQRGELLGIDLQERLLLILRRLHQTAVRPL
jgi:hypothetical protein